MPIETSCYLQTMMDNLEDERVEVPARRCERNQRLSGKDIEDGQEYLDLT